MFEKKSENNSTSSTNVFRPAKGSAKVLIGNGVSITGEIKKADEVQIDGEADVTMKTDNLVVGPTGHCKGNIETQNADIWGTFDGDIKAYGTLTIQEEGKVSAEEYPISPDPIKLPEYPKYPTREEILEMATFIREFTADKGEEG